MRRTNRRTVWGAAAVVAGLAAAACARDANAPGAGAPAAALSDGAVVRAALRDEIEVPRSGGAATVRDLAVRAAEAVMVGGVARDGAGGALLALGAGHGGGHRELRQMDEQGREHRLVFDGPADRDGPPTSARYERDGELVAEVDLAWEHRGGGYVLRERTLTLHRNGRVLLRQVRRVDGVAIAAGVATAVVPGSDPDAPPQLWRAEALPCLREWALYIGASAAMLVAGEVFTMLPNPATAAALTASIGAWETALNRLLTCQVNSVIVL
jgi:hypothetical protein